MNASGIHMHTQSSRIDATMAARIAGAISTSPNEQKRPNSPSDLEIWCRCEADGFGNDADGSTMPMDVQNNGNDPKMATNASRNIRKSHKAKIEKLTYRAPSHNGQASRTMKTHQ